MKNWFECAVNYTGIDQLSGKEKKITDVYLVDAISYTEAEARINKEFEKRLSGEFSVKIKENNLTDIFEIMGKQFWYKCRIAFSDIDEKTGKAKTTNNTMYINADSIHEALVSIHEELESIIVPCECISIAKTKVIEVFNYI